MLFPFYRFPDRHVSKSLNKTVSQYPDNNVHLLKDRNVIQYQGKIVNKFQNRIVNRYNNKGLVLWYGLKYHYFCDRFLDKIVNKCPNKIVKMQLVNLKIHNVEQYQENNVRKYPLKNVKQ